MAKLGLSVNDIWQLALPADTLLLAGRVGLARTVDWVALLRATAPLFTDIKPGYIALARVAFYAWPFAADWPPRVSAAPGTS